jgi:hypothetical protein
MLPQNLNALARLVARLTALRKEGTTICPPHSTPSTHIRYQGQDLIEYSAPRHAHLVHFFSIIQVACNDRNVFIFIPLELFADLGDELADSTLISRITRALSNPLTLQYNYTLENNTGVALLAARRSARA